MNPFGITVITPPDRLPPAREAIAEALQRLFRAMGADENDEEAIRTLQDLVDRLLDAAPAASTLLLERRLLGLARALEEMGAQAEPDALVARAILRDDRLH